jgi:hypothetical protein
LTRRLTHRYRHLSVAEPDDRPDDSAAPTSIGPNPAEALKRLPIWRGTEFSNPSLSSGESCKLHFASPALVTSDSGRPLEARLAAFVARSAEVLKFFADCGIRFRLMRGVTDHYYEKAPGSRPNPALLFPSTSQVPTRRCPSRAAGPEYLRAAS